MLGPTGNLRAPTLRVGKTVIVGFNDEAYASVFLVGLFTITSPFTTGMAMEIGGTAGGWISMFNLSNIPVHVNDVIFGQPSSVTRAAPAAEFSAWLLVGWYFLWILVPAGILSIRYRRLTP